MPFFEKDDTKIYYEVHGEGFPILLFAPGGMRICIIILAIFTLEPYRSAFERVYGDRHGSAQCWPITGAHQSNRWMADLYARSHRPA